MKRLACLITTLSVAALLMFVPTAGAQQNQDLTAVPVQDARSVFIEDYFFDLADAGVTPGTTVVWFNQGDEQHTVTADDGSFDSGPLNPGDYFMVTFLGSGTVTYHCEIYPSMVGSITVSEDSEGNVATDGGGTEDTSADSGY